MDSQKDMQATGMRIDSKNEASGASSISVSKRNPHFDFLNKKTEKMVTALYMVTNFFPVEDPLKAELRKKSLLLLSLSSALESAHLFDRTPKAEEVRKIIRELASLFEIGFHTGFVSQMNFQILQKEFEKLSQLFGGEEIAKRTEKQFELPEKIVAELQEKFLPVERELISNQTQSVLPALKTFSKGQGGVKDMSLTKKAEPKPSADTKNSRQESIISIFKKTPGKELMIKDISLVIHDCSEKTIQRELIQLVKKNVLKKEGERRWSKYSLK